MSLVVPHTAAVSAVRPYAGLIAWAVATPPFISVLAHLPRWAGRCEVVGLLHCPVGVDVDVGTGVSFRVEAVAGVGGVDVCMM